jgi:hypothetical protein
VLGEGQQERGEAVGELGVDAWSGAGAGESLGWCGTRAYGSAVARQRRWQSRKKMGGGGAREYTVSFKNFRDLTVKPVFLTILYLK